MVLFGGPKIWHRSKVFSDENTHKHIYGVISLDNIQGTCTRPFDGFSIRVKRFIQRSFILTAHLLSHFIPYLIFICFLSFIICHQCYDILIAAYSVCRCLSIHTSLSLSLYRALLLLYVYLS